jgi:hypothetical protein
VLGADDDVAGDPSPGPPKDASLLWRVGDGGWSIATLADLAADADAAGWTPLAPGVSAKAGVRDRTLLLRADEGAAWPVTIPCMAFAAEAVVRGDADVR